MPNQTRVLIAEDDVYLATAYKIKFTKAGFSIQIAKNGDEVFSILESFTPDVILLDLLMPIKDGFTVLTELKSSRYKEIPVIIASNLGQEEHIKKGMNLGAVDFIVKSDTSLDDIIDKINRVVQKPL